VSGRRGATGDVQADELSEHTFLDAIGEGRDGPAVGNRIGDAGRIARREVVRDG